MKKTRKFNAAAALGSLTAAVALLAGVPEASAQTAPGGGAFPGSFLVPGTNTSVKIGGFVKIVGIEDLTGSPGTPSDAAVISPSAIPLQGSGAGHNSLRFHAKQSNINVDTRTPTAYGDLTTFVLLDFFGQNTSQAQSGSNTMNARVVYAYGTLGPFLAGQWLSLWADTDAVIESVDPTGFISVMDGLTNRQPQFRYTFAAPGGLSAAVSVENPEADGFAAVGGGFTASSLGGNTGYDKVPDFVARVRMDQAWGHVALSGLYREIKMLGVGVPHESHAGYGVEASGHLNTIGKDKATLIAMWGKALGHYMSNFGGEAGLQASASVGTAATVAAPQAYGMNVGYTHWWTTALRSSLDVGYARLKNETGILGVSANALDKRQYGGRVNLIWSPVPQVDLGVEYDYIRRTVQSGAHGNLNRLEVESVFKF